MSHASFCSRPIGRAVLSCTGFFLAVNVHAALPTIPDPDTYPRSVQVMEFKQGAKIVRERPLKTVRTLAKQEALADRLIVAFKTKETEVDQMLSHSRARTLGAGAARPLLKLGARIVLVDVTGASSLEAAARAYAADPEVKGVSPDWVMHGKEIPNDPRFAEQGGLNVIQAPLAWNRTHGSTAVTIAILDSGVDETHPDLAGKVWARADFTGSGSAADVAGHGTHVAGIAAAVTNNALGIAGVGYDAQLLNARVLDGSGNGSISMLYNAIRWAKDKGAKVINMSLSGDIDCNPSWAEDWLDIGRNELRDAIDQAFAANIVLVGSAGNEGADQPVWPAACPNVLAVANTTNVDQIAFDSNFGSWVDLAAPGSGILSTALPGAPKCQGGLSGGFAFCSGTSMAAPHVAGLAALVRASCGLSSSTSIASRITSTADAIPGTGTLWRFGRINAFRAVCFPAPGDLRIGNVTASSIQLLWRDTTPGETRFELSRQPVGGTSQTVILPANAISYVDSGLASGASVDYRVRACDALGCGNFSAILRGRTGAKLTVAKSGSGKITSSPTGINCGGLTNDCDEVYASGTTVQLTATEINNPGSKFMASFDHWEGACAGQLQVCTISMNASKTAKAVFISEPISDPEL